MKNKRAAIFYFSLFCCGLVLVINFACQKKTASPAARDTTPAASHSLFRKDVGGPIDSATAHRYRQNLLKKVGQQKSVTATTTLYYLPGAVLDILVGAPPYCGRVLLLWRRQQGYVHLVPIGVDIWAL